MAGVLFLGDICSHGYTKIDAEKFLSNKLGKFLTTYEGNIVGNLEAPILKENILVNNSKFSLLNPPENKSFFDFCTVLTLANNHIFDQGIDGYNKSIEELDRLNIKYLGAGQNVLEARMPEFLEVGSIRVALLAYNCYSTNSSLNADASNYGTAPLLLDFIKQDVNKLKSDSNLKVDKVIVLPHWGIENQFFPTAEQVNFARNVIDIGVDAVVGSHTHTIQSSEVYKGKPIYYSLGNFLFNNFSIGDSQTYYQTKFNKEGMMLELLFDNGEVSIKEHYIKFDDNMIPDYSDIQSLSTDIKNINRKFDEKVKNIDFNNAAPELSLSLKYNGRSSQIVYNSVPIDKSIILNIETYASKIKRLLSYRLRKLL